jgi:hypothetical protein
MTMTKPTKTDEKRAPGAAAFTWLLEPPAPVLTPAVARRWLHRSYPALAELANIAPHVALLRAGLRREERERAESGLRVLALDLAKVVTACGRALATGRPQRIQLDPCLPGGDTPEAAEVDAAQYAWNARRLRAVLKLEARLPHRGARGALRRSLHVAEARAREAAA